MSILPRLFHVQKKLLPLVNVVTQLLADGVQVHVPQGLVLQPYVHVPLSLCHLVSDLVEAAPMAVGDVV